MNLFTGFRVVCAIIGIANLVLAAILPLNQRTMVSASIGVGCLIVAALVGKEDKA